MRRREFITLLGGAAAWPLAAGAQPARELPAFGFLHDAAAEAPAPLTTKRFGELAAAYREAANRGAAKLVGLITPSGEFVYSYDAASGKVSRQYNMLRHAGSLWALLRVKADLTGPEKKAVMASFRCLRDATFVTKKGQRNVAEDGRIKVGGNGLALLAVTEMLRRDVDPGSAAEWVQVADELAKGIVGQIQADGRDFHDEVSVATGKPLAFRSEYYAGEALFGLLNWYRLCRERGLGSEQWHGTPQERVFQQKVKDRYGVAFQSHWMAYTVSAYQAALDKPLDDATAAYAVALCDSVLHDTSYRDRRDSTPIACRSEAVMALFPLLPESHKPPALLHAATDLSLQLKWLRPDGAVTQGDGSNKVRIDYIQHSIGGWNAFANLKDGPLGQAL